MVVSVFEAFAVERYQTSVVTEHDGYSDHEMVVFSSLCSLLSLLSMI